MAKVSAIAWTRSTFNPWIGCTKIGPGCDHCYAEQLDKSRFSVSITGGTPEHPIIHWGVGAPRYRTKNWQGPVQWNVRAMKERSAGFSWNGRIGFWPVFCASLADVFDNEVPDDWRWAEYALWKATPWLRWIVLTKRPGNIQKMLPDDWSVANYPNVGFMCSVCTQEELDRDAPKLIGVPAAWHGLSIEPQVERVSIPWKCNRSIQWIITGGASRQVGYDPPPYDVAWAQSLVRECEQVMRPSMADFNEKKKARGSPARA